MTAETLAFERDERTDSAAGTLAGCVTIRVGAPDQPVVVLDHDLLQRLEATLKRVAAIPTLTGLVIASTSERVFIAGADLKAINGLTDEQLDRYLAFGQRVFGMIPEFPVPTAAAINGAALGGGLELALHCDAIIAAPSASGRPYPVGLPEASLGICPGWGGTNLFPARIDPATAIQRTAEGKPLTFDEAAAAGLFDAVAAAPADLLRTAKRWIAEARTQGARAWTGGDGQRDGAPSRWIGRPRHAAAVTAAMFRVEESLPRTAPAEAVIGAVRTGLESGWSAALAAERRHLLRLRNTPEAKGAIRAFLEKSGSGRK